MSINISPDNLHFVVVAIESAAKKMGISPSEMHYRLKKQGLIENFLVKALRKKFRWENGNDRGQRCVFVWTFGKVGSISRRCPCIGVVAEWLKHSFILNSD